MSKMNIYETAVELRELLNKLEDWKHREAAKFFVSIEICNRFNTFDYKGLYSEMHSGGGLNIKDMYRVMNLSRQLKMKLVDDYPNPPERYASRVFVVSVVLGQEYASEDVDNILTRLGEVE